MAALNSLRTLEAHIYSAISGFGAGFAMQNIAAGKRDTPGERSPFHDTLASLGKGVLKEVERDIGRHLSAALIREIQGLTEPPEACSVEPSASKETT